MKPASMPCFIPDCRAASRASCEGYRTRVVIVVWLPRAVKVSVLRVSGHCGPQVSVLTTRSGRSTSWNVPLRISSASPSPRST